MKRCLMLTGILSFLVLSQCTNTAAEEKMSLVGKKPGRVRAFFNRLKPGSSQDGFEMVQYGASESQKDDASEKKLKRSNDNQREQEEGKEAKILEPREDIKGVGLIQSTITGVVAHLAVLSTDGSSMVTQSVPCALSCDIVSTYTGDVLVSHGFYNKRSSPLSRCAEVACAVSSGTDHRMVTKLYDSNVLQLWNENKRGHQLKLSERCDPYCTKINANVVITSDYDNGTIQVWDVRTGGKRYRVKLHDASVKYAISNQHLAIKSCGSIHIHDLFTGEKIDSYQITNDATGIALSVDGRYLATTVDQTVFVWDLQSKKHISSFNCPEYVPANSVRIREDNTIVVLVGDSYGRSVYTAPIPCEI